MALCVTSNNFFLLCKNREYNDNILNGDHKPEEVHKPQNTAEVRKAIMSCLYEKFQYNQLMRASLQLIHSGSGNAHCSHMTILIHLCSVFCITDDPTDIVKVVQTETRKLSLSLSMDKIYNLRKILHLSPFSKT